jgi:hypothetical protein
LSVLDSGQAHRDNVFEILIRDPDINRERNATVGVGTGGGGVGSSVPSTPYLSCPSYEPNGIATGRVASLNKSKPDNFPVEFVGPDAESNNARHQGPSFGAECCQKGQVSSPPRAVSAPLDLGSSGPPRVGFCNISPKQ